jgi:hypothetical protein
VPAGTRRGPLSVVRIMAIIASASCGQAAADGAARLRSAGFLAMPGILRPAAVTRLVAALDRVYDEEVVRDRTRAGAPMHLFGEIGRDDLFLELVDHPLVFPVVWGELGWSIHLYHCRLDVTPPQTEPRFLHVWGWHQDPCTQSSADSAADRSGARLGGCALVVDLVLTLRDGRDRPRPASTARDRSRRPGCRPGRTARLLDSVARLFELLSASSRGR